MTLRIRARSCSGFSATTSWMVEQLGLEMMPLARFRPVTFVGQRLWNEHIRAFDQATRNKAAPDAALEASQKIVQEELERLPPAVKAGLARAHFEVRDLPDVSDLVATDPPLSPGILGLFRPPPESAATDARPTILLYRRNLSRAAHNDDELRREVRDTLMHEVGHLNGEDDEQLRDRGL